jgi:hypothetical protein
MRKPRAPMLNTLACTQVSMVEAVRLPEQLVSEMPLAPALVTRQLVMVRSRTEVAATSADEVGRNWPSITSPSSRTPDVPWTLSTGSGPDCTSRVWPCTPTRLSGAVMRRPDAM